MSRIYLCYSLATSRLSGSDLVGVVAVPVTCISVLGLSLDNILNDRKYK